jgi:hypothetical protein
MQGGANYLLILSDFGECQSHLIPMPIPLLLGMHLILGLYATPNGLPCQLIHIMDAIKVFLK